MPFPVGSINLQLAGYHFKDKGTCRGCGAAIEWWLTPRNASMPLDHVTLIPHWGTCPARDQFRKPKAKQLSFNTEEN